MLASYLNIMLRKCILFSAVCLSKFVEIGFRAVNALCSTSFFFAQFGPFFSGYVGNKLELFIETILVYFIDLNSLKSKNLENNRMDALFERIEAIFVSYMNQIDILKGEHESSLSFFTAWQLHVICKYHIFNECKFVLKVFFDVIVFFCVCFSTFWATSIALASFRTLSVFFSSSYSIIFISLLVLIVKHFNSDLPIYLFILFFRFQFSFGLNAS